MKLVVISPEQTRADELSVVTALFAAGLERYHVRKPHASSAELEKWIEGIPARWRGRLVLHQHHELVPKLGLGGCHWKDERGAGARPTVRQAGAQAPVTPYHSSPIAVSSAAHPESSPCLRSRSCHDLATVRAALGVFDSVFFGPVFPSISKPGYAPRDAYIGEALGAMLLTRNTRERRTTVIAIGGITAATAPRVRELGFDGAAVLGAVWQAADPVNAFVRLQTVCRDLAVVPPATATVIE